ncbi:MAG TPA: glutamine--fructose-6-phosphate transaminase (isomerizing) [Candidatus Manganitrophaceae bacterium]|nr:glutamine--fructose-6-phosphate transaminase (isomerizing) [Candidatus Manganitrophaceae bacterium]
MCGIVGYVGNKNTVDVLLSGLKRLEYRGYDSAGVSFFSEGKIVVEKKVGKLKNLAESLSARRRESALRGAGVGHTRWATHGEPNLENAHPHRDCAGKISVVHNGIVENYAPLKKKLQAEGHRFTSETDTEVIAHLIEKHDRGDLKEAVRNAAAEMEGMFAIGVIHANDPGRIVAMRRGSPLVIGVGRGESFIASDIPALLPHTQEIIFLDDEELAVIRPEGQAIEAADGSPVQKEIRRITWKADQAEKGGYAHYMLKEIHEQPAVILETARRGMALDPAQSERMARQIKEASQIYLVACGTSWHAALIGKQMIEKTTGIRVEVDIASEFRYRDPILDAKTITIGISQSGETADTLAALQLAKEKNSPVWAICNVVGSNMTRLADSVVYTHAGPEIGVASTKAFTCQLVALYLLAHHLGLILRRLTPAQVEERVADLSVLSKQIRELLQRGDEILTLAKSYAGKRDFLYMGRGIHYPVALEGALKLKEISYIHAEGYPAGEMKHGPIALIDREMPVLFLAPQDGVYEKVLGNIEEVRARGGRIIALAQVGDDRTADKAHHVVYLPKNNEFLNPILMTLPLQLLAYYVALEKGCDVDQPRNLAKSVTVE